MRKKGARQLSASTLLLLFATSSVGSTLCPEEGCPADQQNEITIDSFTSLILPEQAAAADFHVSAQFVAFVNTTTPGPQGSKYASSSMLSFYIDQELLKPITVQLAVSSSDRRALSRQPYLHWWRQEERSWKPLCPTAYDAELNTVSAEIPADLLNANSFATQASPALCGAFYVDDTWTCATDVGETYLEPVEATREAGSKGWDWSNLNTWQILVVTAVSLVVGVGLGGVAVVTWIAWRRVIPPEPPKDTAEPNLFPKTEDDSASEPEPDLEITHNPVENLNHSEQKAAPQRPIPPNSLLQQPPPLKMYMQQQQQQQIMVTDPEVGALGVMTYPEFPAQFQPLMVSESPATRQINPAALGNRSQAECAGAGRLHPALPRDAPPLNGAEPLHEPHRPESLRVPSPHEQHEVEVRDEDRTPTPMSIPEEPVSGEGVGAT
mmetsp:Transcript_11454/g.27499  ORF Transcript_11454/g.27499 Transcript_11454/m.27499 type:complete len:437 (+) Transcript_11454:154-1464(+)